MEYISPQQNKIKPTKKQVTPDIMTMKLQEMNGNFLLKNRNNERNNF